MAESRQGGEKSSKILSFAKKKTRRVQQKMMERVGKSERTMDEYYTDLVVNFNKQQLAAARLQKELGRYTNSIKAVKQHSKLLLDLWLEFYESDWTGHQEVTEIIQHKYLLWDDLIANINSQLHEPLLNYMSKFPETKKLVEKRERKVVDYDYAKRELEATRQKQKSTEVKIQQAEETFHQAKTTFDEVTEVLYNELPALYDSRIDFYSTFFQNMTTMDTTFHEEMARLDRSNNEHMNSLHKMAEEGVYAYKRERPRAGSSSNNIKEVDEDSVTDEVEKDDNSEGFASAQGDSGGNTPQSYSEKHTPTKQAAPPPVKPPRHDSSSQEDVGEVKQEDSSEQTEEVQKVEVTLSEATPSEATPTENGPVEPKESEVEESPPSAQEGMAEEEQPPADVKEDVSEEPPPPAAQEEDKVEDEEKPPPVDDTTLEDDLAALESESGIIKTNGAPQPESKDPPPESQANAVSNGGPTVLSKVVAAHTYTGEDEDELTFERGETICIIPFVDPDDEEEGWKMGMIEGTGRKGLFPINFTKPLT